MNTTTGPGLNLNRSFHQCRDDSGEYKSLHTSLLVIGSSVLLLVGTGGNLVTYNVFTQRTYKDNVMASMFRYLSALDTIFLWTMVLQLLIKGISGYHLITSPLSRACLIDLYFAQVLLSLANWLLVVVTVARLVHLKYPLQSHTVCSKMHYRLCLIVTHLFVIVVHGGDMLKIHLNLTEADYNSGLPCYYHISRKDVSSAPQKLRYMTVNFIAPAFLLIVGNALLIIQLRAAHVQKKRRLNQTPSPNRLQTERTSGLSGSFIMHDRTHNALWCDSLLEAQHKALNSPKYIAYNESTAEAHSGERALHEHGASCNDKGMVTSSQLPCSPRLHAQRCWRSAKEKTQISLYGFSQKDDTTADPRMLNDKVKRRRLSFETPIRCNDFDEIEVKAREFSNVMMSDLNVILVDTNLNNTDETDIPSLPADASLADGSDVASQCSHSQAVSGRNRQSTTTGLSDTKSHGVDMDWGENSTSESDVQENPAPTSVHDDAVIPSGGRVTHRHCTSNTLTLMLIVAGVTFLLLNTPYWIIQLNLAKGFTDNPAIGCSLRYMVLEFVFFLRYANHSVNWIFYCAVASRFRHEFFFWVNNLWK